MGYWTMALVKTCSVGLLQKLVLSFLLQVLFLNCASSASVIDAMKDGAKDAVRDVSKDAAKAAFKKGD